MGGAASIAKGSALALTGMRTAYDVFVIGHHEGPKLDRKLKKLGLSRAGDTVLLTHRVKHAAGVVLARCWRMVARVVRSVDDSVGRWRPSIVRWCSAVGDVHQALHRRDAQHCSPVLAICCFAIAALCWRWCAGAGAISLFEEFRRFDDIHAGRSATAAALVLDSTVLLASCSIATADVVCLCSSASASQHLTTAAATVTAAVAAIAAAAAVASVAEHHCRVTR
jgi:hypothetical protein